MKVGPQSYRGIDFVREPELPADQQEALRKTPDNPERIKILINGKVVENCIYYKDYEHWYNEVFRNEVQVEVPATEQLKPAILSVSHG